MGQGLWRLGAAEAGGRGGQGHNKRRKKWEQLTGCLCGHRNKKEKGKVGEGHLDRKFHLQWLKIQQIFFQQKSIIRHLNGRFFKVKCWVCIHHTKHMLTTKCTTTCYVTTFNFTFLLLRLEYIFNCHKIIEKVIICIIKEKTYIEKKIIQFTQIIMSLSYQSYCVASQSAQSSVLAPAQVCSIY